MSKRLKAAHEKCPHCPELCAQRNLKKHVEDHRKDVRESVYHCIPCHLRFDSSAHRDGHFECCPKRLAAIPTPIPAFRKLEKEPPLEVNHVLEGMEEFQDPELLPIQEQGQPPKPLTLESLSPQEITKFDLSDLYAMFDYPMPEDPFDGDEILQNPPGEEVQSGTKEEKLFSSLEEFVLYIFYQQEGQNRYFFLT